jgi:hypothetical protein
MNKKLKLVDCSGNVLGVGNTVNQCISDYKKHDKTAPSKNDILRNIHETKRFGYIGEDKTIIVE